MKIYFKRGVNMYSKISNYTSDDESMTEIK